MLSVDQVKHLRARRYRDGRSLTAGTQRCTVCSSSRTYTTNPYHPTASDMAQANTKPSRSP